MSDNRSQVQRMIDAGTHPGMRDGHWMQTVGKCIDAELRMERPCVANRYWCRHRDEPVTGLQCNAVRCPFDHFRTEE